MVGVAGKARALWCVCVWRGQVVYSGDLGTPLTLAALLTRRPPS